jgi:hypothetical protein
MTSERLANRIYVLLGLIIGIYPEIAALGLAGFGAYLLLRRTVSIGHWTWAFVAFGLVRGVVYWRSGSTFFLGPLEAAFALSLYGSALHLRPLQQGGLVTAFLSGAVVTAVAAIYLSLPFHLLSAPWQVTGDERVQARLEHLSDGSLRLQPLEPNNAYVTRDLGLQGSGSVQVKVRLRSQTPVRLRIAVTHQDFDVRGDEHWCAVETDWSVCQFEVRFRTRGVATLYMGGDQSWKANDGVLDLAGLAVELKVWPQLGEWLRSLDRIRGWTFNPNAFAGLMTMAVIAVSMTRIGWLWVGCAPLVIAVVLSGSRGALLVCGLALLCGILLQLSVRWRWWLGGGVLLGCAWLLWGSGLTLPRALSWDSQDGSNTSRFELYNAALQAWSSSVLFGVGDLTRALKEANPAQADGITHAHNLLLQMLGDGGVLQLAVLLLTWAHGIVLIFAVRDWRLLAFFALWLLFNQFDYLYWYAPVQIMLWFILSASKRI